MSQPVHALDLFDVSEREKYLAYARRSAGEVAGRGGRVVALGRFREAVLDGTDRSIWHLLDELEDLGPVFE